MTFFENMKKNVKKAADYTSKKTEEISYKVNLKLSIRSAESKIAGHYTTLGKLFYDSHVNGVNFDSDILAEIKAIDGLKDDLKKLRADLAKAEKKMFCPKCSTAIDIKSVYCPVCGEKIRTGDEKTEESNGDSQAE